MIILVGASATGKSEICKEIIKKFGFEKMVTTTSRPMRVGEIQDADYHFITNEEFERRIQNNEFLEYVNYSSYYYGTNKKDCGENKVLIVEPNGANALYDYLKDNCAIFYLITSEEERIKRMHQRGDDEANITKRINNDKVVFQSSKLTHIDFYIEAENKSIEEIAYEIYTKYVNR